MNCFDIRCSVESPLPPLPPLPLRGSPPEKRGRKRGKTGVNYIGFCLSRDFLRGLASLSVLSLWVSLLYAQPAPGDVFREYMWYNEGGDAGAALRVGGSLDYGGDYISIPDSIDLIDATKAEIVIEKILCHDGTQGLSLLINESNWIEVPENENIPKPQWDYQHHTYPIIPIPIEYLYHGKGNKFKMKVSPIHPWDWPQNLINGVHFRIYYDQNKKTHPTGQVTQPVSGEKLGSTVELNAEAHIENGSIKSVQYIGYYEDVNYEGDGIYRQWHYHFLHGVIKHHLGTSSQAPYPVNWKTSWVPDQLYPMKIAARFVDESGMIYFSKAVEDLQFDRPDTSVVLLKPYDVPKIWVTRKDGNYEKFYFRSDLDKVLAAQLVWTSWSPCYMDGIYINDIKVFHKEGPCYQYYAHRVHLSGMNVFNLGENILKTGGSEYGVHGMEVQWPGIMVLMQRDFSGTVKTEPLAPDRVTLDLVSPDKIILQWTEGADNEKGFIIERKSEAGTFAEIGRKSWHERCVYQDSDLDPATGYYYRVLAFNDYGESAPSREVAIKTPFKAIFLDFSDKSHFAIPKYGYSENEMNWIENGGLSYLSSSKGVGGLDGILLLVSKNTTTSTFVGESFSFAESHVLNQSIFFKANKIKERNIDVLKFGLISESDDQLQLDSSDSSFIAISVYIPRGESAWGLRCDNKVTSEEKEITNSTSGTISPEDVWYKLTVNWTMKDDTTFTYFAKVDEYNNDAKFVISTEILSLSGEFSNESISNDDEIFAAISGNRNGGIMFLDNFFVYNNFLNVTSVKDNVIYPPRFILNENYPNPFNPSTTIKFAIPTTSHVSLKVYNILGQEIINLVDKTMQPGIHGIVWNGKDSFGGTVATGLYFYQLISETGVQTKKMLLQK